MGGGGRQVAQDEAVGGDPAVVADGDRSQDGRAGPDHHPVADDRVTAPAGAAVVQPAPRTERDAVIPSVHVVTDDGCFADERRIRGRSNARRPMHAPAWISMPVSRRASRVRAAALGRVSAPVEAVGETVQGQALPAGVQQRLAPARAGRVALEDRLQVLPDQLQQRGGDPWRRSGSSGGRRGARPAQPPDPVHGALEQLVRGEGGEGARAVLGARQPQRGEGGPGCGVAELHDGQAALARTGRATPGARQRAPARR